MRALAVPTVAGLLVAAAACGAPDPDIGSGTSPPPVEQGSTLGDEVDDVERPVEIEDVLGSTTTTIPTSVEIERGPYDSEELAVTGEELFDPLPPDSIMRNDIEATTPVGAFCFAQRELTLWVLASSAAEITSPRSDASAAQRVAAIEFAAAAERHGVPQDLSDATRRALDAVERTPPPDVGTEFYERYRTELAQLAEDAAQLEPSAPTSQAIQLYDKRLMDMTEWDGAREFEQLMEDQYSICES